MAWKLVNPNITNDPSYLDPRLSDDESKISSNTTSLAEKVSKGEIIINVLDYGADKTGATDSTTAFVNALTAASGGRLFIPAGTYLINPPTAPYSTYGLAPASNTIIEGVGNSTILKMASNAPSSSQIFSGVLKNNIIIRNLVLDGSLVTASVPNQGIVLYKCTYCIVDNVVVQNFPYTGFSFSDTQYSTFKNSKVTGCGKINSHAGAVVSADSGSSYLTGYNVIDNCEFSGNGMDGLSLSNQGGNIITNCKAFNNGLTVGSAGIFSTFADGLILTNNIVANNVCNGFDLGSGSGLIIENNISELNGWAGISVADVTDSSVCSNTVRNNGQSGTNQFGIIFNSRTNGCNRLIVTENNCYDNQITKTQQTGIWAVDNKSQKILVANNNCIGNGTNPIASQGDSKNLIGTNHIVKDNLGYNPVGPLTPPAIPASATNIANNFNFPVRVFIGGGTVSNIAIGGQSTNMTGGLIILQPHEAISITYTSAPYWVWSGM